MVSAARAKFVLLPAVLLTIFGFLFLYSDLLLSIDTKSYLVATTARVTPGDGINNINNKDTPRWFIGCVSPASGYERRQIIRETWQRLYTNGNERITTKFVLARPSEDQERAIGAENLRYNDLLILPWLEESSHTANTIKPIEFLSLLATSNISSSYEFVSKIDDDSFVNVPLFVDQMLSEHRGRQRVVIGRDMTRFRPEFPYPGGQFYTMSADMVTLLASLYKENKVLDEHEDRLVGRLLYEAGENFTFVPFTNRQSFDLSDDGDPEAWSHRMLPGAINPHKMKGDAAYEQIAEFFDESGLRSDFLS